MSDVLIRLSGDSAELQKAVGDARGSVKSLGTDVDRLNQQPGPVNLAKGFEAASAKAKATEASLKGVGTASAQASAGVTSTGTALGGLNAEAGKSPGLLQGIGSSAKMMAGALGLAFSVGAITRFVVGITKSASEIDDLSKKVGVSREAIQRWKYAAEQSGQSIETIERAVSVMNMKLADGDKSTVAALKKAGLSFDEIRRMRPEDAFNAIVRAIEDIEDPMARADVAVKIFGKTGQDLLPAIADGFADTAAAAKVMSDETIQRLDAAGDAWVKLSNTVTIYSGEILGATMRTIDHATSSWSNFFKTMAAGLPGGLGQAAAASLARDIALAKMGTAPAGDPQAAEERRRAAVAASIAAAKAAAEE
ncbi:MAG: hypothetical protein H0X64_11630, partial [Gemmatimonadaceae bacterium]|nr:hypothetical protein [Gemmatimonadaceae bacterium]